MVDPQLQKQQEQLVKHPKLDVVTTCSLGNGILKLGDNQILNYTLQDFSEQSCFFIPASGMGSRMFGFLFQFLVDGVESDEIKQFFRNLELFPFYDILKSRLGSALAEMNQKDIITFILSKEGLDLAEQPKGMITFHRYAEGSLVPFEEHLLQIQEIRGFPENVHYSVQESFMKEINNRIVSNDVIRIHPVYSFQDPETDAYCFNDKGDPVLQDGDYLRRPAGHGALLKNLNELDEEIVFIKNIDNLQPRERAKESMDQWRVLNGLLSAFKKDLKGLSEEFSRSELMVFNQKYQIFMAQDLDEITIDHIELMCSRPTRVCGMVINEGAPGGGPFWVVENGIATKQIVEKVQLGDNPKQTELLSGSTHFNPVFMVVDKVSVNGVRCDLNDFVDPDTFIRVVKDQKGQKVIYHELPGLWNGSMAFWNTVFVEVPKSVFTPVKTVLDLIGKDHLSQ